MLAEHLQAVVVRPRKTWRLSVIDMVQILAESGNARDRGSS